MLPILWISAFGDYVGIKKDLLTEGGTISPGFIYYSVHNNYYVGFKARKKELNEFTNHIAPQVVKSVAWSTYAEDHRKNCPGCTGISEILYGNSKGNSATKWKGFAIGHYLYTMEDFLSASMISNFKTP